jgi:hypothetical protein
VAHDTNERIVAMHGWCRTVHATMRVDHITADSMQLATGCHRCEQRIGDAVGIADKEIDQLRHETQVAAIQRVQRVRCNVRRVRQLQRGWFGCVCLLRRRG